MLRGSPLAHTPQSAAAQIDLRLDHPIQECESDVIFA